MSSIAALMRSDWGILRFISALWASVIRDYAPDPSLFQRDVSHRISISPARGWEGSGWRPVLVTLEYHDECGVEEGQIWDAHELEMTSVVHSTLAILPVSPQRISLINGHQGEVRLPFWLDIQRSLWLNSDLFQAIPFSKHATLPLALQSECTSTMSVDVSQDIITQVNKIQNTVHTIKWMLF